MIIWRGLGFLVVLIPFVLGLIFYEFIGESNIYASMSLIISGVLIGLLGNRFNINPTKTAVDSVTGQIFY